MKREEKNRKIVSGSLIFELIFIFSLLLFFTGKIFASNKDVINLTLDKAINVAMQNSYTIKQLRLSIKRDRYQLQAERAGLKSRVEMELEAPEFRVISEYEWDSEEGRDILVRRNTRLWQMNFAVKQPVILFGYPTNGYLSLNNEIYRYKQIEQDDELEYYNRYFIKYEQPIFQPNKLKNDIENAELNLQQEELNFIEDAVGIIDEVSEEYNELFRDAYQCIIGRNYVKNLEVALRIADSIAEEDESRQMDVNQLKIELNNEIEEYAEDYSDLRRGMSQMKQKLRINREDSLYINPEISIEPVDIDKDRALKYAFDLSPFVRLNRISRRQEEIEFENIKGENSFRINLEATYGLEKQDTYIDRLLKEPDNSYTLSLNAYLPIWDWGEHEAEVAAQKVNLEKWNLYIEEAKEEVELEVENDVKNLREYQERMINMRENVELSRKLSKESLEKFRAGDINLQTLLQVLDSQQHSDRNFLDIYLRYRNAMLSLMMHTYYDFESGEPLLEKYGINEVNK